MVKYKWAVLLYLRCLTQIIPAEVGNSSTGIIVSIKIIHIVLIVAFSLQSNLLYQSYVNPYGSTVKSKGKLSYSRYQQGRFIRRDVANI